MNLKNLPIFIYIELIVALIFSFFTFTYGTFSLTGLGELPPLGAFISIVISFNFGAGVLAFIISKQLNSIEKAEKLIAEGKVEEANKELNKVNMNVFVAPDPEAERKEKKIKAINLEDEGELKEALKIWEGLGDKENIKRLESVIRETKINEAKDLEKQAKFDYAMIIYKDLGLTKEFDRVRRSKLLTRAKNLEEWEDFEKAAKIYESLNMWDKAFELMKKHKSKNKDS